MLETTAIARAIAAAGGPEAFRASVGISPRTLATWRKFGVPDTRWADVARAAGGCVAVDDLARERASALSEVA